MTFAHFVRDLVLTVIIFVGVVGLASAIAWGFARKLGELD